MLLGAYYLHKKWRWPLAMVFGTNCFDIAFVELREQHGCAFIQCTGYWTETYSYFYIGGMSKYWKRAFECILRPPAPTLLSPFPLGHPESTSDVQTLPLCRSLTMLQSCTQLRTAFQLWLHFAKRYTTGKCHRAIDIPVGSSPWTVSRSFVCFRGDPVSPGLSPLTRSYLWIWCVV